MCMLQSSLYSCFKMGGIYPGYGQFLFLCNMEERKCYKNTPNVTIEQKDDMILLCKKNVSILSLHRT